MNARSPEARREVEDGVPVYNYVSSVQNRLTWWSFTELTSKWGRVTPSNRAVWSYSLTFTKSRTMYLLLVALLHFLPALLVDVVCFVIGNPFRSVYPGGLRQPRGQTGCRAVIRRRGADGRRPFLPSDGPKKAKIVIRARGEPSNFP